jgi:hypothetical protein
MWPISVQLLQYICVTQAKIKRISNLGYNLVTAVDDTELFILTFQSLHN